MVELLFLQEWMSDKADRGLKREDYDYIYTKQQLDHVDTNNIQFLLGISLHLHSECTYHARLFFVYIMFVCINLNNNTNL